MPSTDKSLPENSKQNLDKRLDHAIKETFPTSDPVSVSITKGGAIDYDDEGIPAQRTSPGQGTAEQLIGEARAKLGSASHTVSQTAQGAYRAGSRHVREAMDDYPEAQRYYREGTETVRQQAAENPLLTFLLGIGVGYAAAWMIHAVEWGRTEDVPEYARTRTRLIRR